MRRAVMAVLCVAASIHDRDAHADDTLDKQVRAVLSGSGDAVSAGVWLGTPAESIYELDASRSLPAASVIKTAILVELFAAHAGYLDEPLGADSVLADDAHAALAPFSTTQRTEIRKSLTGATVRVVGSAMMGSRKVSNAVYNAAANLAIASLGGPSEVTAKIHARDARFGGLVVARYMLAARTPNDNMATPASLAAVLAAIAGASIPRVDAATVEALAQAMMQSPKQALGTHHHKEGNLDTDPIVVVKTGFYVRGNGKPPLIYVVGAALSAKPSGTRDAATRRLDKMTDAVLVVLRAAVHP